MMGVAVGAQFCQNILYQQGAAGDLYSTGTIFWMNITVGVKVFTGIGSIALLMLSLVAGKSEEKE
jgi:multicomponent Na+:H+ antiporter subunit B